uniref:NRF domain-containing protein n=1 Tax=Panagrellus redivivus TaxID=6233 RepID=A0A7E4V6L2_PANRE
MVLGLLLFLVFQETTSQFHGFPLYKEAINSLNNSNSVQLSSKAFSYAKSMPSIENILENLAVDDNVLANLTADCSDDVDVVIDSSGKISSGILLGNKKFFGLFKECQAIEYNLGNRTFTGKYRHVTFALGGANETTCATVSHISNTFTIDLCLPTTCSAADIETIVNGISKKKIVCEVKSLPREAHANAGTWITLVIIAVVLFLGLTASIFDYFVLPYHKQEPYVNSLLMQCWRSFSLYTNVVEIFNTKGANKPGNIGPLNCMRFFSICWVVMGHSMLFFLV